MNLFTIEELSKKVPYTINTLYKKKKQMTLGLHYFQVPNGKILFCDEAVSFFLNKSKGTHENKQRNCVQEERKPLSLSEYLNRR